MADAGPKKFSGPKKPSGGGGGFSGLDGVEVIVVLLVVLFLARSILSRVQLFLSGQATTGNAFFTKVSTFLDYAGPIAKIASVGISALSIVGILYLVYKITKLRGVEHAIFHPRPKTVAEVIKNKKWERIQSHINSVNPSDWKLSILEADIVLGEMLESMGYPGLSIGDKLKMVEKSDFTTIDSAWEAHRVRNEIAHQGSDYLINEREARRIISLYEAVFKEFNFI